MLRAEITLEMARPTPLPTALLKRNPVACAYDDSFAPILKMSYPDRHIVSTPSVCSPLII
jgi:hypothetical protein